MFIVSQRITIRWSGSIRCLNCEFLLYNNHVSFMNSRRLLQRFEMAYNRFGIWDTSNVSDESAHTSWNKYGITSRVLKSGWVTVFYITEQLCLCSKVIEFSQNEQINREIDGLAKIRQFIFMNHSSRAKSSLLLQGPFLYLRECTRVVRYFNRTLHLASVCLCSRCNGTATPPGNVITLPPQQYTSPRRWWVLRAPSALQRECGWLIDS